MITLKRDLFALFAKAMHKQLFMIFDSFCIWYGRGFNIRCCFV